MRVGNVFHKKMEKRKMFLFGKGKQKNKINLDKITFKYSEDYLGEIRVKGATFDAFSLATLMNKNLGMFRPQIIAGMKIVEGGQLIDMDEFLKYFPLLKSKEKLIEQDDIWKKICNELKWEFIPSI